jgi:hypothetical protein
MTPIWSILFVFNMVANGCLAQAEGACFPRVTATVAYWSDKQRLSLASRVAGRSKLPHHKHLVCGLWILHSMQEGWLGDSMSAIVTLLV